MKREFLKWTTLKLQPTYLTPYDLCERLKKKKKPCMIKRPRGPTQTRYCSCVQNFSEHPKQGFLLKPKCTQNTDFSMFFCKI